MKYLLLFLFFIPGDTYAQKAFFREIKLRPDPKYYDPGDSIVYPIIVTGNSMVDKKVNDKIKNETLELYDEEKVSTRQALKKLISDGVTSLWYEITLNRNGILSMKINVEETVGRLNTTETYFNFDLRTGNSITIADILNANMVDSFKRMVLKNKNTFLKKYKEEEKEPLQKKYIDSTEYSTALQQVDEECMDSVNIENFSLSKNYFQVIDPCEFPMYLRSQEPDYELKYSYKTLQTFLKPTYRNRL